MIGVSRQSARRSIETSGKYILIINRVFREPVSLSSMYTIFLSLLSKFRRIRRLKKEIGFWSAYRVVAVRSRGHTFCIRPRRLNREIFLRSGSSDFKCFKKVFIDEEYRSPFVEDPNLIVDAGANIGMATLYYSMLYPSARIYSIEPEESNFVLLAKNCKGLPNVTLIKAALWKDGENLVIADSDAEKWEFTVAVGGACSGGNEEEVQSITISDILRISNSEIIDILKIDIEGAEREVFAQGYTDWLGSVRGIVIELHDRVIRGCTKVFYKAIEELDYHQEIRGENIFVGLTKSSEIAEWIKGSSIRERVGDLDGISK
jgi:FkbM family methyltransferase